MTTLNELIQQVRNLSSDTSVTPTFTDAEITDFINRAISDLTQYFPRQIAYQVSATAGTHEYYLEVTHIAVLSAEYPISQDPRRYLTRRPYTDIVFWLSDEYYDFYQTLDADSGNPPVLVISANPTAGQKINLQLTCEHNLLTDPTDETTILAHHEPLIGLFCLWKMWQHLAIEEGMDPNPLKPITQTNSANAIAAEATYRAALKDAQAAAHPSAVVPWRMPGPDRVY